MTINKFIETLCLDNADQLVTIYDRNNNIIYHGKADFAPLNLFDDVTTTETKAVTTIDGDTVTVLNINERTSVIQLDKEKRMRYSVTTRGNCFLRGFTDFQTAIDFCCSLDICVKLFDNCTGVTVDLGMKKIDQLKSRLNSIYGVSAADVVYYDTDSIKVKDSIKYTIEG